MKEMEMAQGDSVADASTGWSIAGLRGDSVDQVRAGALEAFGRLTPAEWQRKVQAMAKAP